MMMPECHCVCGSKWVSLLNVPNALERKQCETAFGNAKLVFHVVAGQGVVFGLCCEALSPRLRTGMMGRRISLLGTERSSAALEALVGTYLVVEELTASELHIARESEASRWRLTRAGLSWERLCRIETCFLRGQFMCSLR